MSFDGILLNKLIDEFKHLVTGRITKIAEMSDTDFIFTIRQSRKNEKLLLSFQSEYSRIHLALRDYDTLHNPRSFTMLLRKHIEGAFILDIFQYECDRILIFKLGSYNEIQDYSEKYLICEIMGRYSNLILTDSNYQIIDALKHDGVGEYNRTILPNAKYVFPETNKLNPLSLEEVELENIFKTKNINSPKELMDTFLGVSNNICIPVFENNSYANDFYNYMHNVLTPVVFLNHKNKPDFYFFSSHNEVIKEYESLSVMLEEYYFADDKASKIKRNSSDLIGFVKKQIKKYENKIEKLNRELITSLDSDDLKTFGELLLSVHNPSYKDSSIKVLNYYTNEYVNIPLDNRYDLVANSQLYFKKYKKSKSAVLHLEEQIAIANDEIKYFEIIKSQLEDANNLDVSEIEHEMAQYHYILPKKQEKLKKPKLLCYIIDEDVFVYVGKNNIQNEYLTHQFAKSNELWFHVKDAPGSHVLLRNNQKELKDEYIRTTAMIAAYYSSLKGSSSVPVNYTLARYIKKIPGKRNCFVSISHEKTIFIDPSDDEIRKLKVNKQ